MVKSHVRISMDIPQFTVKLTLLGLLNILEKDKNNCPSRFYQKIIVRNVRSTVDDDGYQRKLQKMEPTSPYGCTKVFGYNMVRHYRFAYKLFACNGILFNHESPRRGSNFVTNKVVKSRLYKLRKEY